MEKVKRIYKVFNFNELSDEVKQNVIDKWYKEEDYPFLEDDIDNELECIDEYKVFENTKLQYSLSYCQGSGLSFEAEINILNFLDYVYSKKLPKYKKEGINEYTYKVYSKGNTGYYSYASESDINFECNYQDNIHRLNLDRLWHNILKEIQQHYLSVCEQLEKFGYAELDYRMTFDEFDEHCELNEYKFLEDGEMFN